MGERGYKREGKVEREEERGRETERGIWRREKRDRQRERERERGEEERERERKERERGWVVTTFYIPIGGHCNVSLNSRYVFDALVLTI